MTEITNCIFIVYAQVYENKGYHQGTQDWRPKGGQEFSLKINYSDFDKYGIRDPYNHCGALSAIFTGLLYEQSCDYYRYEYLNHDVWFGNPIRLNKDSFYAKLKKMCFK
tara:strand:+ start:2930 stop:3256 length:327 start_codon:yes stop_codon:yes gene_type:complete